VTARLSTLAAALNTPRARPTAAVTMSPAEWRWAIGAALLVLGLTCIPYGVAWLRQDEAQQFTGFLLSADDGHTYLAKMAQGARGDWLFTQAYAAEPGPPLFLFPFYLVLGKLTGPDVVARIVGYHAARVVFGFAYLVAAYVWIAGFSARLKTRRLGFWLLALGGGLGWLALGAGGAAPRLEDLPLDLYLPEAFSFLLLMTLPHLAAARFALVLGLIAYRQGRAWMAGLLLMLVAFIVPLYPVVAGLLLVLGDFAGAATPGVLDRVRILTLVRRWLLLLLPAAPYVSYILLQTKLDPALAEFMDQNILLSPNLIHYALAYGPWAWFGWIGWRALRRDTPQLATWAAVWLALGIALTYIPISTQRRIIDGYWLWLAPLAARGLTLVSRGSRWKRLVLPTLWLTTLPGIALAWGGALGAAMAQTPALFIPQGQVVAFEWLAQQTQVGGVVLASFQTGNWVPAYTPFRAYLGHGVETPQIHVTEAAVARFFGTEASAQERAALLMLGHIDYVLWGPEERALGDFEPGAWQVLERVYASDGYEVYRVRADVHP